MCADECDAVLDVLHDLADAGLWGEAVVGGDGDVVVGLYAGAHVRGHRVSAALTVACQWTCLAVILLYCYTGGCVQETAAVEPEEDGGFGGVWWEVDVHWDLEGSDGFVCDGS